MASAHGELDRNRPKSKRRLVSILKKIDELTFRHAPFMNLTVCTLSSLSKWIYLRLALIGH